MIKKKNKKKKKKKKKKKQEPIWTVRSQATIKPRHFFIVITLKSVKISTSSVCSVKVTFVKGSQCQRTSLFNLPSSSYDLNLLSQADTGDDLNNSRLWNHTKFADWVTIWVVHVPERAETGLITTSDQFTGTDRNGLYYRFGPTRGHLLCKCG